MRVVFHLADYITVLDQGALLVEGTPKEIARRKRCRPLILGNRMTAALTAEGLHTYYGKSHICMASASASPRQDHRAVGAQRRRQRPRRCAA